jgi:Domain of unknown function (DUF4260)
MKYLLKLEEAASTAIALYFLGIFNLGLPLWVWAMLFFLPDISMLGYLAGSRPGAVCYNLFHHKGIALALALGGYLLHSDWLTAGGILLFAHASFDRIWGYGLKHSDGFNNTHLGRIGKE